MYVCGITPYDTTHLGHAFTYMVFDVLQRYLVYSGYPVLYTQNVTDINDRDNDMLKKAKEQNIPWNQLGKYWTERFLEDMKHLNWIKPTQYLRASEHIHNMILFITSILKNGCAYEVNGSVYLDIKSVSDFGKLSGFTKQQMMEKAKAFEEDLTNPDKRHPLDITLWRASSSDQPPHIPSFDSPWGKGRPGWHIECSTMSIESLGEQIDIHGGGIDLIYPHHESEIAQSECVTGKKPFVKYWMHTGVMSIAGEKMSKSLGNLILVSDLLKTYSANAIRWVLLSHHYREGWEYDESEFVKAEENLKRIKSEIRNPKSETNSNDKNDYKKKVISCLDNDLDVPSVLHLTVQAVKTLEQNPNEQLRKDIKEILEMMGFTL